jgi:protein SCO1/2
MFKANIKYAVVLIVAGLGLIFFGLSAVDQEPEKLKLPEDLKGVIIDSPPTLLPDFKLVTNDNHTFTKDDLQGKWTLMFAGYTHCPDVCPTSLRVLDKVSNERGLPDNTQFVFMSVDPGRDTPQVMDDFVSYFNEGIIGLTGDKSVIDTIAEPLGIIYDYEGDVASGDYIVNHFAAVYILDPQGRERAYILPPHNVDKVSRSFKLISEYYE